MPPVCCPLRSFSIIRLNLLKAHSVDGYAFSTLAAVITFCLLKYVSSISNGMSSAGDSPAIPQLPSFATT